MAMNWLDNPLRLHSYKFASVHAFFRLPVLLACLHCIVHGATGNAGEAPGREQDFYALNLEQLAWVKWTQAPSYRKIGPGHYLDLDLGISDLPVRGPRVDLFANLDLGGADTPSGTHGGVTESFGHKYGFRISYSF